MDPKASADVIGNAVKVLNIATGEEPEDFGANDGERAAQSRDGGAD